MADNRTPVELLGVDIGGTFTDFVLRRGQELIVHKLLSTPDDPSRALLQGVRELSLAPDGEIIHGSTVATNALLERKGARTALITTRGFADVIEIGRQNRPLLYAFHQTKPAPLVARDWRIELGERLDYQGTVLGALDPAELPPALERMRTGGIESVAVCLLFSFVNPAHERMVGDALRDSGLWLSLSSDILPEYREYERVSTTIINAYVAPVVARYVGNLEAGLAGRRLRIMQSNGGSISASAARDVAARLALSGPAGGIVGAFTVAQAAGFDHIITFDMGGTSTDVALCTGQPQETNEGNIAGFPMRLPILDIHTVGAGGGSLARIDAGGALRVGPESSGANPGPACYGRGCAQVTVTDANLMLGRIAPGRFLGGRMRLDAGATAQVFEPLAAQMGVDAPAAAHGVIRVVNANMERAIRHVSVERGYDPREFTLVAFGGAGPLHACALAEALGIPRVLVPRYPGVLSALGMLNADLVKDFSASALKRAAELDSESVARLYAPLVKRARDAMAAEDVPAGRLSLKLGADMRYAGQSYELTVPYDDLPATLSRFHAAHLQRFGHADEKLPVEFVTLRVKAVGETDKPRVVAVQPSRAAVSYSAAHLDREALQPGDTVAGPSVIYQFDATTFIDGGWRARVDGYLNLIVERLAV
ncbi:MAG: hydantoinase/oxoprolinase family protein [Chloroflexi bacterium]|nr:hydantoinase/oxoprolinase family protein [Chloroflexota bacterium]